MPPSSTTQAVAESAELAGSPILVVDDHEGNLLAVEVVLAPLGHRIVRASSGRQALRFLLEEDFAVILLDVMMPELDGFETARLIRSRERSRTTPIIFLSAVSISHRDIVRGYAEGAVDYLVKPFDPDVLRAKVDIFVELHRSREEIRRQAIELTEVGRARDGLERNLSQTRRAREVAEERAASYRVLAESIPQQVWTAKPDGALDYVNPIVLAYFDQTSNAILGAGWQSVIHPDDLATCVERWVASLTTGARYEVEFRLRRHDGQYRWHIGRAAPERGPHDQILRWFGTNTDIDDRKRAEDTERKLASEEAARLAAVASEERVRQIMDSISDPMFILDAAWRIESVNIEATELLAKPQDAVLGRSLWELFPQAAGSASYEAFHRARRDGVSQAFESYVAALETWFEVTAYPTRDGRLCVYYRIIDARKQAEARQAREHRHVALRADIGAALSHKGSLADMLRASAEAIVRRLEVAFARIWTLNAASNVLELEASAGLYTHLDGPHGRVPVGQFKIGRIAERREPHLTNDVAHDPEVGDPAWAARTGMVGFAGYPLVADGACIGVVAMFSHTAIPDDTLNAIAAVADVIAQGIERKRAEHALEIRAGELARSNAELERFAYVASHDLQEPLRMVASYTQLLGRRYKGKLDGAADEFIGFAVDGANRMQALINDLLTFSRVGTRAGQLAHASLEKPFASAIANLKAAIDESAATVTHDPLPALAIDAHQMVQLFQNLIGNAIKFRSTAPPVIQVSAQPDGADWRFCVRDNGIGISSEFFDRLFVLFQRLHTRAEYPGNGIGLAICKKIVERHGGRIWVEAEPGAGTAMWFTLRGGGE
jgi:PAS domain S-box-containing protein